MKFYQKYKTTYPNFIWTISWDFGTYRTGEHRKLRRACAYAQSRQNLRFWHTQSMGVEKNSYLYLQSTDSNLHDPWWAFSLTDHIWTDSYSDYSADPRVMQDHSTHPRVVQDSHTDYSADPRVVQYSADRRVVQYSADQRVVQFNLTSTGIYEI